MMRMSTIAGLALSVCGALQGCTADRVPVASDLGSGGYFSTGGSSSDAPSGTGAVGVIDGGIGAAGAPLDLPDEVEERPSFLAPVSTGKYLWSTNPESGRVALINAETLDVRVFSAGLQPTYLTAIPGPDEAAAVINVGNADASLFVEEETAIVRHRVPLHSGANSWAVSASGRWLVAYSVQLPGQVLPSTEGLQEITVIDRKPESPTASRVTVGYRPQQVVFDEAEERLLVVDEEGISIISLSSDPQVERWVQLGKAAGRDVSITQDGLHALVRRDDESSIQVVPLERPEDTFSLVLSGPVTDLDLTDGRAVGVLRQSSSLFTFMVEDVLADPNAVDELTIDGELIGSVEMAGDGSRAVLFTNAVPSERISIVSLEPGDDYLNHWSLSVSLEVQSVSTSPGGEAAIALSQATSETAFSVVTLTEKRFPRVVSTSAPVRQLALSDDAAIVTAGNSASQEAHLVSLPSLAVRSDELASPPLAAGIMSDPGRAYVAQEHPEGRVTFFHLESAVARTLTGYELSADVVNE